MADEDAGGESPGLGGERLEQLLLGHHARLLGFLERRLGSRADAEEVLQAAAVKALDRGVPQDSPEGVLAWFYRVLRNALVDRARRSDVERRAADRLAQELVGAENPELRDAVCACLHDLLPGLKPEYAQVLRAVDLEGRALREVAAEREVTVNNATVRLHRARQAMKTQLLRACGACAAHGCLECHCRTAAGPGTPPRS